MSISERHLIAIGKVASNFALLELFTSHVCRAFLGTDALANEVVTRNLNYSRLLDVIGGLAVLRLPEGEPRREVFRVLDLAQEAATLRNKILHSAYAAPDEEGEPSGSVLMRVHRRSSRKKGLHPAETNEGTSDIEHAVGQIRQVLDELAKISDVVEHVAPDIASRLRETPTIG